MIRLLMAAGLAFALSSLGTKVLIDVLTRQRIGQPIREDVDWERGGATVTPDWAEIVDRRDELLERYRDIFGG